MIKTFIVFIILMIISLFDTRKNFFNLMVCTVILIFSTYFTYVEYGFSFMLLVPTLLMMVLGGMIGGNIRGMMYKFLHRNIMYP
jgi:hypothetical protein